MGVQKETALQNQIRLAVSKWCPGVTLFRNHCGALLDNRNRMVRFGLAPGSADLIGIRHKDGKFISIEIKLPGEKPRADQINWMRKIEDWGGLATVVTSVEDAVRFCNQD